MIARRGEITVICHVFFGFENVPAGPPGVSNIANRVTIAPNSTYPNITCGTNNIRGNIAQSRLNSAHPADKAAAEHVEDCGVHQHSQG